jgi:HEAT repeat protein
MDSPHQRRRPPLRPKTPLTKIGGSKALTFLCGKDGVRSTDSFVQRQAVDALSKSDDARCLAPLLTALGDPALKIETVGAICITLGKTAPGDEKVAEMLSKEAADRRDTVRASALEALGYVPGDKAFPFLLEPLQHDRNAAARAGAATGLGHAGKQNAIPALQAAASGDKSEPVKAAAIQSLKDLGATGK